VKFVKGLRMTEKRNNKRVRVNMKVDYTDDAHIDKMGRVIDISKGGNVRAERVYP
jgi:hypothetical protein